MEIEGNFSKLKWCKKLAIISGILTLLIEFLNSLKDKTQKIAKFVRLIYINVYFVCQNNPVITRLNKSMRNVRVIVEFLRL